VDVFVYFSHYFVTIPPKGWIDAAHKNGVVVLGTVITEWDRGRDINIKLLKNKKRYVKKLVDVCCYYGFDGWLVNIEAECDHGQMRQFLKLLTEAMHKAIPHSQVIWYDSIGPDGKIKYYNRLTPQNKLFFDVCDGIVTNYAWKAQDPKRSALLAGEGGDRRFDVYTGIDVFGRGTFGGGGFNTFRALSEIKGGSPSVSTSVCLFAAGWTFEVASRGKGRRAWMRCESKFWDGLNFSKNLLKDATAVGSGLGMGSGHWLVEQDGGQGWARDACNEAATADNNDDDSRYCWVTSHQWCLRSQVVDLLEDGGIPKHVLTGSGIRWSSAHHTRRGHRQRKTAKLPRSISTDTPSP
jgi:hypothetical protein